jgi:hypothetical protein
MPTVLLRDVPHACIGLLLMEPSQAQFLHAAAEAIALVRTHKLETKGRDVSLLGEPSFGRRGNRHPAIASSVISVVR